MSTLDVSALPAAVPPQVQLDWTVDVDGDVRIARISGGEPAVGVRMAEPIAAQPAGASGSVIDYECPFGVPVRYLLTTADGTGTLTAPVTLNPTAFYPNEVGWSTDRGAVWLRHLTIPQLSMPVDLANADSPVFKQTRTVVDVLNRRSPIVVSDGRRKNPTTQLEIRTWSLDEAAALRELVADNSPLLLSVPAGERWGLVHWYVTAGDLTEGRLWQEWAPFEGRVFQLPVEVVDRPAGGVVHPECCYWSVQRGRSAYIELGENYPDYTAMTTCAVQGPELTIVERVEEHTNDGVYPPGEVVTVSLQTTVVDGVTYTVTGNQWIRNTTDPVTAEVRYGYGTQVGPGIGVVVASETAAQPQGAGGRSLLVNGSFVASGSGTVTVVYVLRSAGSVEDGTGGDYDRVLLIAHDA